jgi:hypothetical protein
VVVAALAKSGHRRLRAGRGAVLEQHGDMENPFWGLGWGGAHQRWLPMVACFGRRWTLGRGRRSGEDGSLNGRRGAPRCGDARGGGGKTRRQRRRRLDVVLDGGARWLGADGTGCGEGPWLS